MIIRPKDWKSFQHYTDRRPVWIKLHRALLDNYEFHCLPVASRALAPMLWLLASESVDGLIDGDPGKLAFRLRQIPTDVESALKPLIAAGFFEVAQDASATLALPERNGVSEKRERREETEREGDARARDVSRGTTDHGDALTRTATAEQALEEILNAWRDVDGVDSAAMTAWLAHWSRVHGGKEMPSHQRIATAKLLAGLGDAPTQRRAVETAEANGWKALRHGDGKAPRQTPQEAAAAARRESERVEWANLEERAERIGFRRRTKLDDLSGYRTLVERAESNQPRKGAKSAAELLGGRS